MYYHGICLFQKIHLMLIDINAVSEKCLHSQNAAVHQTVHDPLSIVFQTVMQILDSLCHMNVIADPIRLMCCSQLHGLIGDGKGRVHSHHTCDHITVIRQGIACKPLIFHYRFTGLLHPVSVRDLIAEAGADPQVFCRFTDGEKAVGYAAEAGMVIEHRCHTVFNTVKICGIGTVFCPFQCQMPVNGPPHTVQNIQKSVRIVAVYGQTSCKRTVNMLMCIDKCRHDHTALCIHIFSIGKFLFKLSFFPCLFHHIAVQNYCPVFKKRRLVISCHKSSVPNH